jgi:hypothetical protein
MLLLARVQSVLLISIFLPLFPQVWIRAEFISPAFSDILDFRFATRSGGREPADLSA